MYSERSGSLKSSAIRDILKITSREEVISFAGGLPAPDLFPLKEIQDAVQNVMSKYGASALQYSETEGLLELREKIAESIGPDAKRIGPQNILITHGSQQGLDLISKLFINKGDPLFTENPTYLGALQPFRLFQADIRPLLYDEKGVQIDSLLDNLESFHPKLTYLMPNFQNPTGISLSLERRLKLVEIAKIHNLLILEDDPYGKISFESEVPPSLFNLGKSGNYIYMSTFSKTIAPGFRVAFIAANKEIITKLSVIKQGTDLHTNTFGQYVINEYLESGCFDKHIILLKKEYKNRRDCMISAMEQYFPSSVTWNRPAGGMFLWVKLPEGCDANQLFSKCIDHNVAFVPGQEFFPDSSGINTMRLNFSNASPENIEEGIKRMGNVMSDSI